MAVCVPTLKTIFLDLHSLQQRLSVIYDDFNIQLGLQVCLISLKMETFPRHSEGDTVRDLVILFILKCASNYSPKKNKILNFVAVEVPVLCGFACLSPNTHLLSANAIGNRSTNF